MFFKYYYKFYLNFNNCYISDMKIIVMIINYSGKLDSNHFFILKVFKSILNMILLYL